MSKAKIQAMSVKDLIKKYGEWNEHPDYPRSDWTYEVHNGDTSLGYWEYVESMIESNLE